MILRTGGVVDTDWIHVCNFIVRGINIRLRIFLRSILSE